VAARLAGAYRADDGSGLTLRARGSRLFLDDDGVPLELRPAGAGLFVVDGRLRGEEEGQAQAALVVGEDALHWQNRAWRRTGRGTEPVPAAIVPHLGRYAPSFMPTRLIHANGRLVCLIENLSPHVCEPLAGNRFLLQRGMYDSEPLELGLAGASGRPAIRIGEVMLEREPC
jgi:hypothetical protein